MKHTTEIAILFVSTTQLIVVADVRTERVMSKVVANQISSFSNELCLQTCVLISPKPPDMSFIQVSAAWRSLNSSIPIVQMTADVERSYNKTSVVLSRYSGYKKLIVMHVSGTNSDLEDLEDSLPVYCKWVGAKLANDYYLFSTPPASVKTTLTHPFIASRIKYKLAIAVVADNVTPAIGLTAYVLSRRFMPIVVELRSASQRLRQIHSDFHGASFTVSVPITSAATQIKDINGSLVPYKTGGKHLRILLEVAKHLNFSAKLVKSANGGTTGIKLDNGTWTGTIGDILYGRATLAVGVGILLDRLFAVDFCTPFDYVNLVLMHAQTKQLFTWRSLFLAFHSSVWIALGFSIVAAIGFLHSLHLLLRQMRKVRKWCLVDLIFCIFASFLGQIFRTPRGMSVQVFILYWYFFVITVMTMYTSKLFEIFMIPSSVVPPRDFSSLASSSCNIGMVYHGGVIYNFFKKAPVGSSGQQIFKRMHKMRLLPCHEAALNMDFACISFDGSSFIVTNVHMKEHWMAKQLILERPGGSLVPVSLAVQRHSILRETLNRGISCFYETGLTEAWARATRRELREEYLRKGYRVKIKVTPRGNRLNMNNLRGLVFIFGIGILAACVVVAIEILQHIAGIMWSLSAWY